MNILRTARAIYEAVKDDEMIVADIRCEYKRLAGKIATDVDYSAQITSASVNGQSFSKENTITHSQRLLMLGEVVRMFNNGFATSHKTRPIF